MVRRVVVLGGGFAGIKCVQSLCRRMKDKRFEIILIDMEDVHVFKADLYEVATAFNEEITDECLVNLKETVATPIADLVDHDCVKFIQSEVTEIITDDKKIRLKGRKGLLAYDYLVVAMGADSNYFGIPGLEKYSYPMKTVDTAIKVNCHLDQIFHQRWKKADLRTINIVVGGGGATGVETSGELMGAMRRLCRKYNCDLGQVRVHLIEGTDKLVGLDVKGTKLVKDRLERLGVRVHMNSYIERVTKTDIILRGGDLMRYDLLIWGGGVKVNSLIEDSFGGAIKVNPFLQSSFDKNVFAAGDNSKFGDAPMLAQVAYSQGAVIAENLMRIYEGKKLKEYIVPTLHYVIPIGPRYAIWRCGKRLFAGRWVYLLKKIVYLKYAMSILPFWEALKKFFHSRKVFEQND